MERVSFSPDGQYILAHQPDRIGIFRQNPFVELFHIDAQDVVDLRFTVDSKSIVFVTAALHLEVWDLATQKQTRSADVLEKRCMEMQVSPEGDTLACLQPDDNLELIGVSSQKIIFEKARFAHIGPGFPFPHLAYSPDGRFFIGAVRDMVLIFDLQARHGISTASSFKETLPNGFAFIGIDRVAACASIPQTRMAALRILSFPDGKLLDTMDCPMGMLRPATHGDFLLLTRMPQAHRVGVLDLKTRTVTAFGQGTVDVHDDMLVHSMPDGSLGLYDLNGKRRLRAQIQLSSSGSFVTAAVSPNLEWVAACGASRCAVWSTTNGKQAEVLRKFRSGSFDGERTLYADFPQFEKTPRSIAKMDVVTQNTSIVFTSEEGSGTLFGHFFAIGRPHGEVEVRDVATGQTLWTRQFKTDNPFILGEPEQEFVFLAWPASSAAARKETKAHTTLQLTDKTGKQTLYTEALKAATGEFVAAWVSDVAVLLLGNHMLAVHRDYMETDSAEGKKQGDIVGQPIAFSTTAGLLLVRGESENQLALYDISSRQKIDDYAFHTKVNFAHFSQDGKRVFVLTNDQTGYILKTEYQPLRAANAAGSH